MTKRTHTDSDLDQSNREREVLELLWRNGLVVPTSDEQMLDHLHRLDSSGAALPNVLADYVSAVDRILGPTIMLDKNGIPDGADGEEVQSLRRAARNGKSITSEIEEAMRQARNVKE